MNPRRVAVEDRVLALADIVSKADPVLAALLRETVPDSYGLCDDHVPHMRETVEHVGDKRVYIAEDAVEPGLFCAYWDDESGWLEQGPRLASLEVAREWAKARSDDMRLQYHRNEPS